MQPTNYTLIRLENERRPLSSKSKQIDRATQKLLADLNERVTFTAKDVAQAIRQNRYKVLVQLRRLEKLGAIERHGLEKTSEGKGRKAVVFRKVA